MFFVQVALDFSGFATACCSQNSLRLQHSSPLGGLANSCEINRPGSDFLWFRSGTDRATFEGPHETAAAARALQTCHEYLQCFGGMVSEATLWGNSHLAGQVPHVSARQTATCQKCPGWQKLNKNFQRLALRLYASPDVSRWMNDWMTKIVTKNHQSYLFSGLKMS